LVLGYLLARMGVNVWVLEKHADFLRDFRGDTIHPSTLEIMYELRILKEFLQRPHQELRHLSAEVGKDKVTLADFTHLPTHCQFLGLMPQWDFLDFIKEQARPYRAFHLKMEAEVIALLEENSAVRGVRAKTPDGWMEVRAPLTIGADGRTSIVRDKANLSVIDLGAPMDVMWMRISRKPTDPTETFGRADRGQILIMINRETYWQCAVIIPKGAADEIRARGLPAFRDELAALEPFFSDHVAELQDWKDIRLLTVKVDRLARWCKPGLLCIGDAAHAMSPIGGVGINLAIQDAVATANLLGRKLFSETPSESDLYSVQQRREFPTRATQRLQLIIQNNVIRRVLGNSESLRLPWPAKVITSLPLLPRLAARVVGLGFRPEHVQTADVHSTARR
jgi:2-polyprenyl-6-methoxyphenol hydroxylase-like FAD-dependent oxidoreductase